MTEEPSEPDSRRKQPLPLYDAAVLYWRLLALIAGQLLMVLFEFRVRLFWPRDTPAMAQERQHMLEFLYLVIPIVGMAIVAHVYRLAQWLGHQIPILWAAAILIPCVGLIAILVLTKEAASEFEHRGLRIYVLGPRLRDIPRPPGEAEG